MFVNSDTLCSLKIFEDESHPCVHFQGKGGRGKEGLSLHSLANLTYSPQGEELLKSWFARPLLRQSDILGRQDAISLFLQPGNLHCIDGFHTHLGRIKNIRKLLSNLSQGRMGMAANKTSDWTGILQFCFHMLHIRDQVLQMENARSINLTANIMDGIDVKALQQVASMINDAIDFEESALQQRVVVMRGIDQELDEMNHVYDSLDATLSSAALEIGHTLPAEAASLISVVYLPQLGYFIVMPSRTTNDAAYCSEHWAFQFSTSKSFYYKSEEMRSLDEYYGDVHGLIIDREIEILHQLQLMVLESSALLYVCSDLCAELDW